MKKLFFYFLASFDNFSKGASANRVSAAVAVGVGVYVTKRFTSTENITYVLVIWLLFALLCLGIILFKQITELVNSYKNGNGGKTKIDEKITLDEELKPSSEKQPDINIAEATITSDTTININGQKPQQ